MSIGQLELIREGRADPSPPIFDVGLESEIEYGFKRLPNNKAFAMGLDNLGWYASSFGSLSDAKKEAMRGCIKRVREAFGKSIETQCQLVVENNKVVWKGPKPKSMREYRLPMPDLPLARGAINGNLKEAKGIILNLHGCDGPSQPFEPWAKNWREYFLKNGFAVVEPYAFADGLAIVCGINVKYATSDPVFRKRVAQTIRTMEQLRKVYPGKPIHIWGHSQGALIAQFYDYGAQSTILTGASCMYSLPPGMKKVLHIFGGLDIYGPVRKDEKLNLTDKDVRQLCPALKQKGKRRYVIVPDANHWVGVSDAKVMTSLQEFLRQ